MFRKHSRVSKELLSRSPISLSHTKYALSTLIQYKPSYQSYTISPSSSEHIYKHSISNYHTNNIINIKKCACYLCNKSKFHSSPYLYEQEQLIKEEANIEIDERENVIQQTQTTMNSKIDVIVDEISKLNLLEVSQLIQSLKTKLNLPDTAMMGTAMPMGAMTSMQTDAGGDAAAAEEEPEIQQTIFDIVLKGFQAEKKVAVIKEVRAIYKLGLKEAKALVEKAPCTLQASAPKIEADEIKEKLEALGAEVALD